MIPYSCGGVDWSEVPKDVQEQIVRGFQLMGKEVWQLPNPVTPDNFMPIQSRLTVQTVRVERVSKKGKAASYRVRYSSGGGTVWSPDHIHATKLDALKALQHQTLSQHIRVEEQVAKEVRIRMEGGVL
jgi:hypothetical protein